MSDTRVTMPQLGESVHEGTISKWLVKPGDKVVEFEPMLEVDTDKVNAEVPSPVTGVLKQIIANEGQTVQAGAEIAVVEVDGDGETPAKVELKAEEAVPVQEAPERGAGAETPQQATEAATPQPAPSAAAAPAPSSPSPAPPTAVQGDDGAAHRYSPAVLMLAQEHRVDLAALQGTGLGGRVTKKDVLRAVSSPPAQGAGAGASGAGSSVKATPTPAPAPVRDGDRAVPLTRVRKLIAENMTRSKTTIPHAWQTQEVDMSGVVASRAANKSEFQQREGFSLTYLPYVIKAAAAALREHPEVNATFGDTEILVHGSIDIGVSVGLEDTLLVPVIRNADGLSIAGLARELNRLVERARNKQLSADDLQGATFTVNNSGTFGTLFSYSVINPGQAGILTMEAIVERPVAVNGLIGVKPLMYLCFSFDHRVLDGLQAARFLTSCRKWLESIARETPLY